MHIRSLIVLISLFAGPSLITLVAHADDGGSQRAVPSGPSELPQYGIIIDEHGIVFGSGPELVVPALSGTNATEGPDAGPADYPGPAPDASTYQEAVP